MNSDPSEANAGTAESTSSAATSRIVFGRRSTASQTGL